MSYQVTQDTQDTDVISTPKTLKTSMSSRPVRQLVPRFPLCMVVTLHPLLSIILTNDSHSQRRATNSLYSKSFPLDTLVLMPSMNARNMLVKATINFRDISLIRLISKWEHQAIFIYIYIYIYMCYSYLSVYMIHLNSFGNETSSSLHIYIYIYVFQSS